MYEYHIAFFSIGFVFVLKYWGNEFRLGLLLSDMGYCGTGALRLDDENLLPQGEGIAARL